MDTTPLETDLLRHRDFLLRLATGLVGGNDAEDLVQDVWAKALTHPPASGASTRGWLARVAHNLAVNRFRARSRRQRREQDAARPEGASDSFAELDERFELGHSVAAAVRALDEPYRAVILLRFFEGLDHAAIATRLELPLATVRTRQQRALARLRERLDREHGGREAWSVVLGAWVVRQGMPAAVSGGAGLMLGTAAAVVLALAAGAGWLFARESGAKEDTILSRASATAANAPTTGPMAAATGEGSDGRQSLGSGPEAPRHLLAGRVLGLTPAECRETLVEVDAEWPYAIDPPPVLSELREDGSFEVSVDGLIRFADQWANPVPPREFVLVLDHPVHLRSSVRVPFAQGVTDAAGDVRFDTGNLALVDAAVMRGVLRTPGGAPASGAVVEAFPMEAGHPRAHSAGRTECDGEGRFDLRLELGGDFALAFLVDGLRPAQVLDSAVLGAAHDLAPVALEDGQAIAGRALRLGQPMPLAEIDIDRAPGGLDLQRAGLPAIAWVDGRFEWERVILESDSEGNFRCGGLAAAEYDLRLSGASRWVGCMSMRWDSTRVLAPSEDLALEFRASLITLDRSADSPPDVRGRIGVFQEDKEVAGFWFQRASDLPETSFVAPPETSLSLRIEFEGVPAIPLEIVTPGPGEELRRTISFAAPPPGAMLELELLQDPRLTLEALRVYFESPEGVERFDRGFEQDELPDSGLVRLEDLPPGIHRVRVHAAWDHLSRTPAFDRVLQVELRSGETAHARVEFELGGLLRVDIRDPSGARRRAQFRLLDAAGMRVPMTFHARRDNADMSGDWYLTPWSANESETLAAGDYELVLWDDDLAEQRVPVRVVAGETTEVAVTLQPK